MRRLLLSALCIAAACSAPKAPVNEDFSSLAGLDEKSDAFSYRMKILGSLDYGQTSDPVSYTKKPRFRAFKFGGHAGDQVDAWVRSTNGGDAVAWILDNSFNVLGSNDDADGTLDSHVSVTLTANSDPSIITYYVVFREYNLDSALFTVQLSVKNDFFSCQKDSDCVAVPARMCCPDCSMAAVNKDQKTAYQNQDLECPTDHICPLACRLDTRVAECNTGTGQCEMVEISAIACGGFTTNPHACPTGYDCTLPVSHPDVPGSCQEHQTTGDCRTNGCADGDTCQICWGSYACVPNGAEC